MANQAFGAAQATAYAPALPHLIIEPNGRHSLAGIRCGDCGTVTAGARLACPACGNRKTLETIQLGARGTLYAHTVVHRSYPGVKTPFVSVVVDLDGGGTVRGTLTDVDPLADFSGKLRVEMVFRDTGQRDKEGRPFLCYFFVPEKGAAL